MLFFDLGVAAQENPSSKDDCSRRRAVRCVPLAALRGYAASIANAGKVVSCQFSVWIVLTNDISD